MNTIGTYSLAPLGIQATPAKGVAALANESLFNNVFFSQPLTDFAVGYSNQEEALQEMLDYLAPAVRAPRKFQYRVMNNKAAFEAVADGSDERALYGEFKVVTTHDGIVDDHTISKGLTTIIDKDELEDDPNVLEKRTAWLKQLQLRADLLRTVALLNSLATNVLSQGVVIFIYIVLIAAKLDICDDNLSFLFKIIPPIIFQYSSWNLVKLLSSTSMCHVCQLHCFAVPTASELIYPLYLPRFLCIFQGLS